MNDGHQLFIRLALENRLFKELIPNSRSWTSIAKTIKTVSAQSVNESDERRVEDVSSECAV